MTLRACPLCGSKRLRRCVEDYTTRRARKTFVVPKLEIHRCSSCGEAFLTDEAMKAIERRAARRSGRAA